MKKNSIEDIPLIGPGLNKMLSEIYDILPFSDEVVTKDITIVKEKNYYLAPSIYYKHNNLCLRIVKNENPNIYSDFSNFRVGYGRIENPAVSWKINTIFHCTPELNKTMFDIIVTIYKMKEAEILKYKKELNEHCC